MKRLSGTLLAVASATLSAASWAGVHVSETGVATLSGGYAGSRTELGWTSPKGTTDFDLGINRYRYGAAFPGTQTEWSAGAHHELHHVRLGLRLATQPPTAQRAAYHLASISGGLTFYGLSLGPSMPELSPTVWELDTLALQPSDYDLAWVTALDFRYTNTNHHMIDASQNIAVLVQNSWQFRLEEQWNERVGLALEGGFDRYNRDIAVTIPRPYLENIDYPGSAFALKAWPSGFVGGRAWWRLGAWRTFAEGTRLNTQWAKPANIWAVGVERPIGKLGLAAAYHHYRMQATETREGFSLQAVYRFD